MIAALLLASTLIGQPAPDRTRLLVLTDVGSLTAGVAEPDDGQSLIRLLLYSNEFRIEGLVATSMLNHGRKTRPELIRQAVDAYEKVRPNLLKHDPRYPTADALRAVIKAGQPIAGRNSPVADSVGPGKDTEGSDWIVRVVDRPDPRPIWVLIWGGSTDLAQALDRVRRERGPDELAAFLAKIRVHSIGDQDSTGVWIKEQFPDLYVITQQRAYRGIYRGGDVRLASSDWVKTHIHGHGALGDLYPDYRGGDIFPKLGPVRGIKEGDTPSFLALVPNGLNDPERPDLGGWGGRFKESTSPKRLIDVVDRAPADPSDPDPRMASVYRWRPDFQADFQARLDWCVRPYEKANHPPIPRVAGERVVKAKPGATVSLDAGGSTDPDGHSLSFAWSIYPPDDRVRMETTDTSSQRIIVPTSMRSGEEIPVLLTARDSGFPPLTRYARVSIRVE